MPPMSEEERKARERERNKAYYEANREKRLAYQRAYREANKKKVAEQQKAYREANKEKIAEQQKAYREANKEKILKRVKDHYKNNREKRLAYAKDYRVANTEKLVAYRKAYREANKEKVTERHKAYYEANKEKFLEKSSLRRARKRNAIPKPLRNCEQERQRLHNIYKLRAVISEATGIEHHVDHMWPLSDGGPHWSGNLQIITAEENLSKHAYVCEEIKKVIQDGLEYTLQEYKRRQHVRNRFT